MAMTTETSLWPCRSLDDHTPRLSDLHLWADFMELSCLADADGEALFDTALDERWGGGEGLGGIIYANGEEELTADELGTKLSPAEKDDKRTNKVRDLYSYLESRTGLFGDAYPFSVAPEGVFRKPIAHKHELYLQLLLSANLRLFEKKLQISLTSDFECLAGLALKGFLPPFYEVRLFGTAACPDLSAYPGTPRDKILRFAEELRVSPRISEDELNRLNTPGGDAGLDIVAWLPFPDKGTHTILFLGQAGCTADERTMFGKQGSISSDRWKNKLDRITPLGLLFTPQCYRDARSQWIAPSELIHPCIDRARFIFILQDSFSLEIPWLKSRELVRAARDFSGHS